ncbi:MAG: ATP-dependent 6-phosphofructokinase [Deltaproteobacteria bacterium]|nr:ATP-dependent 6-phosphofructokinase [Deltaproteobacteria bacterium]MBW2099736.1 ATP-dependent 6-phosphofructokinase [Deltaproteobacteria bacterium]
MPGTKNKSRSKPAGKHTKRLGILTGGGDCPGLNAAIRATVKTALNSGWRVYGIKGGFAGLLDPKKHIISLGPDDIKGIIHIGGTILGTTNRGNPFAFPVKVGDEWVEKDLSEKALAGVKEAGLDAVIAIGGDGSLRIAKQFYDKGLPIVGIPKTIDNDLYGTHITFGFDTAVSTATDAIDKLHSTAESHQRVMVVEVMGRYAGWIALNAGVAGGADVILIPEIPFEMKYVVRKTDERYKTGSNFAIIITAEGATPKGEEQRTVFKKVGQEVKLGGIGDYVAGEVERLSGHESRSLVLGHLQRGGQPTTSDRLLATRFGSAAVRLANEGFFGQMVALDPPHIKSVPLEDAISRTRSVPLTSDIIRAARDMGISFGNE